MLSILDIDYTSVIFLKELRSFSGTLFKYRKRVTMIRIINTSFLVYLSLVFIACSSSSTIIEEEEKEEETSSVDLSDFIFTHKMMKNTAENQYSALAYECSECTFEQHQAIEAPVDWSKGPSQVALFSSGELRSQPSFDGIPDTMDFVPEIPGNEYVLIAKTLDATIIEAGPNGAIVQAEVMRDTLLRFDIGERVHELTNPEGNIFVLFAYEIDPLNIEIPDFQSAEFLSDLSAPEGWIYSSRILEEELILDTPDIATVLAIRTNTTSTWEMRQP